MTKGSSISAAPTDADLVRDVAQHCLASRVRLINRAVSAVYDEALRPFGLKVSQVNVLVAVSLLGEARPADLGRRLAMDKSTLSRNVERLRARGWVEQLPGRDARSHRLRVTSSGWTLLREAYPAWRRAQRRVSAILGERAGIVHEIAEELRTRAIAAE